MHVLTGCTGDDRIAFVARRTFANHRLDRCGIENITQRLLTTWLRFGTRIHASAVEAGVLRWTFRVCSTTWFNYTRQMIKLQRNLSE